jgi:hypothetical protein
MTPAAMKGLITYVQSIWDNYVYHSFQERFLLLNKISRGSWQSKFHHSVFHRLTPNTEKIVLAHKHVCVLLISSCYSTWARS